MFQHRAARRPGRRGSCRTSKATGYSCPPSPEVGSRSVTKSSVNTDARTIAKMVGNDAVLSARLLQLPTARCIAVAETIDPAGSHAARPEDGLAASLRMKQILCHFQMPDWQSSAGWDDSSGRRDRIACWPAGPRAPGNEQAMLGGLIDSISGTADPGKIDERWGCGPGPGSALITNWHRDRWPHPQALELRRFASPTS